MKVGNELLSEDKDKSNALNSQFSSVFIDDDGLLPTVSHKNISVPISNLCITRTDIIDAIKCISANSSSGVDGLASKFFKNCSVPLSVPLQHIFIMSLSQGKLPREWKIGKVIPIFKNKGSRSDPANYRPVSLTNISCKIMETVLKKYIYVHLFNNNIVTAS